MSQPNNHLIDRLGTLYMDALAVMAGATLSSPNLDYGIDGSLNKIVENQPGIFQANGFPVDFQLKTTGNINKKQGFLHFQLKVRNYNLIVGRKENAAPYYLFLVVLHGPQQKWVSITPDQLTLNASAFFWKETGPISKNKYKVMIKIPLANQLTPAKIGDILLEAENRFVP